MDKDTKFKHLDYIQAVITRMNQCSFLLKGWSVTLVSALFVFAAKDQDFRFVLLAYFPAISFWILDAFFLNKEKLYRKLYALIINDDSSVPPLEMNVAKIKSIQSNWFKVLFSPTLLIFHGIILAVILLVMFGFR